MIISPRHLLIVLLVLPLFVGTASEEEHHGGNPLEFVGKVVNFLVLFGGLSLLLYKPLRSFLAKRSQQIRQALEETRESRQAAEAKLLDSQGRLNALSDDVKTLHADAESLGKQESDRILQSARENADRLRTQAGLEIDLLAGASSRELRAYVAALATSQARRRLQERLTRDEHSRLIDQSIERLEGLYEKSGSD